MDPAADRRLTAGLFMVTLSGLMYEVLLTRIFSVTMWYHFAFMAISIALFGMTIGGLLVYLLPKYYREERARYHLALSSLLFSITILLSFIIHLRFPQATLSSMKGLLPLGLTYAIISVPFIFCGICVCLALTKFPAHVSRLYAADLSGAATGCLLLVLILSITDGPTAVIAVAFLAGLGSVFFAAANGGKTLLRVTAVCSILLVTLAVANGILAASYRSLLRLIWVKGALESQPVYEKWNSFSRIRIYQDPKTLQKPFGWGLSSTYSSSRNFNQLGLTIDGSAFTVLTGFSGHLERLDYLKYDVTNLAHYLRRDARVLTIGAGGGRDVLSALVFDQKRVVGVEINQAILDAVNRKFGDFTGHLDKNPKVLFVNDEARSYLVRSKDQFEIIQSSLIDTWAATAAGAFVLSENALYTIEAWTTFLKHLSPTGIVTFSRWYLGEGEVPLIYKLTSLASASLLRFGIESPRSHIILVKNKSIGTLLMSREPFSQKDLDTIEEVSRAMQFEIILSPRFAQDSMFEMIASGKDLERVAAQYPHNIAPPTDDSPFFFQTVRLSDVWRRLGEFRTNAVPILGFLLIVVVGLTGLFILGPLVFTAKKSVLKGSFPLFVYFGGIGFGFMLVEVSQMQRLIAFLGHPIYSLTVVLFVLLLSGSFGSYLTRKIPDFRWKHSAVWRLLILQGTLLVFGIFTPLAMRHFQGATTPLRILVAAGICIPIGIFMGMAFPFGIRIASALSRPLTPWLWGVNGSTSVCASVAAIVIAIGSGISASFWAGFLCYGIACLAFIWAVQRRVENP